MNTKELVHKRIQLTEAFAREKGIVVDRNHHQAVSVSCVQKLSQHQAELEQASVVNVEGEAFLLRALSLHPYHCPFELGYQLGRYILRDKVFFEAAQQISHHQNLALALLALNQLVSSLYSFTRFSFSFSGFLVGVESKFDLLELIEQFEKQDEKVEQRDGKNAYELKYFLIGRNMGIMSAVYKTLIQGELNSLKSVSVDAPYNHRFESWCNKLGSQVSFNQAEHKALFDIRNVSFRDFVFNELFGQLTSSFGQNFSDECAKDGVSKLQESRMKGTENIKDKIAALFDAAGTYNISKEEVASALNISVRTLSRRLQDQQTNWRRLTTEIKLAKAKMLLQRKDLNLYEIADYVGFSSLSAFSSAFSREEGVTPSEYSKQELTEVQV